MTFLFKDGDVMNYMEEAYKQAKKALDIDEVPVGAVIVKEGKIIARAYNKKESINNPLGHAEILVIKKACKKLNSWRLIDCDLYVTLEPCAMCVGAIVHSRFKNVYYGAIDPKSGACGGSFNLLECGKFNHIPNIEYLPLDKCGKILTNYFKSKRNQKK